MTATIPDTVRIGDAQFDRPFRDERGELMVGVWYDDGDRFVTYYVGEDVLNAWAEVDALSNA